MANTLALTLEAGSIHVVYNGNSHSRPASGPHRLDSAPDNSSIAISFADLLYSVKAADSITINGVLYTWVSAIDLESLLRRTIFINVLVIGENSLFINSAATTNAAIVKASPGTLEAFSIMNTSAAIKYVRFYNKATLPVPGTDLPLIVVAIPPGASKEASYGPLGIPFPLGIGIAITNLPAFMDATVVAAGDIQATIAFS